MKIRNLLLVFVVVAIAFTSCKKEEEVTKTSNTYQEFNISSSDWTVGMYKCVLKQNVDNFKVTKVTLVALYDESDGSEIYLTEDDDFYMDGNDVILMGQDEKDCEVNIFYNYSYTVIEEN